jgi:putative ABC transport system permease protein
MQTLPLRRRSLTYYWPTNLAVILGVVTAVAVLAGALLVGDSVRASLRDLVVQRLGQTDQVIVSTGFFRDQLASDLQADPEFIAAGFSAACPLVALEGTVTHEPSKRVGSRIKVYGVDERFWTFHQQPGKQPPRNHEVFLSAGLARELGASVGDSLVLRVEKPSAIPVESLHSRKEDLGSTLRLTIKETLATDGLGEFSLQPQQGAVRAVFVPLSLLQKEIEQTGKANLILISEAARAATANGSKTELLRGMLKRRATLPDFGITLRPIAAADHAGILLEHDSKIVTDALARIARETADRNAMRVSPILSYLANSISAGGRSIPYSLATALDEPEFEQLRTGATNLPEQSPQKKAASNQSAPQAFADPPIVLNEWAARELGVAPGDSISLEYYLWQESGKLETKSAKFRLAAVVPIAGIAADKDLTPEYPGITGSENLADWDPPFPVDLSRVRKQDEDYWHQFRTTPKVFIQLQTGQKLWQSRFGKLTSLRLSPASGASAADALHTYEQGLLGALDPISMGLTVVPARAQGLASSQGATDFGEYFLYFSFFLVISALLLSALFFKLGIEQRLREIGLLRAVGFPPNKIRSLFLGEGLMLAILGSIPGLAGAVGYAQVVIVGLRTWWVDAVGTTMLRLHISPLSLGLGMTGGIVAALLCIVWTLKGLGKQSTRALLSGTTAIGTPAKKRAGASHGRLRLFTSSRAGVLFAILGAILLAAAALHLVNQAAGFFGGGTLMLTAFLCYQSAWLRSAGGTPIENPGWWSVMRLGFRNATSRPGRSVLCIALIASAAFIIVAVDSFRHRESQQRFESKSGNGGFPLLAESLLPVVQDPNTNEGRESLGLNDGAARAPLAGVKFARFRVRPGDDASCLNLYQPRNPKIIAPTADFLAGNRFIFQDSMATTEQEKNNPWLLLNREFPDGAAPVIVDANSLTYVLHLKLGDDLILDSGNGPLRLRVVASLADSVFQSELLMSEPHFLRLFPEQEGYRFFLIEVPATEQSNAVAATLEDRFSDFGFDVQATSERLANFHRVENTYLSTFQMLGGLGLLLGTLGMAAVLLRNVLERRRELALLRVVGYDSSHFVLMVIAENALLLFCGLVTGIICALLAIAPVFLSREAQLPSVSLGLLLLAVLISGLAASVVATWAALCSPLLPALRAE